VRTVVADFLLGLVRGSAALCTYWALADGVSIRVLRVANRLRIFVAGFLFGPIAGLIVPYLVATRR
jgi:hypothetical protein